MVLAEVPHLGMLSASSRDGDFQEALAVHERARRAFLHADADARLRRGAVGQVTRQPVSEVGDWVFCWRKKGSVLGNWWPLHSGRVLRAAEPSASSSFTWRKMHVEPKSGAFRRANTPEKEDELKQKT